MRLLAAAVLAFAFLQAPQVLAQSNNDSSAGQPTQLDGGSAVGSDNGEPAVGSDDRGPAAGPDNRGQSGLRPEATEPSASTKSEGRRSKRLQKHKTTAFRRLR
jgi:hypothetical protein